VRDLQHGGNAIHLPFEPSRVWTRVVRSAKDFDHAHKSIFTRQLRLNVEALDVVGFQCVFSHLDAYLLDRVLDVWIGAVRHVIHRDLDADCQCVAVASGRGRPTNTTPTSASIPAIAVGSCSRS